MTGEKTAAVNDAVEEASQSVSARWGAHIAPVLELHWTQGCVHPLARTSFRLKENILENKHGHTSLGLPLALGATQCQQQFIKESKPRGGVRLLTT